MTLQEGEFRTFPFEIDQAISAPWIVDTVSLEVLSDGEVYQVTSIPDECLRDGVDVYDCIPYFSEFINGQIFKKEALEGQVSVRPGPQGFLNNFTLESDGLTFQMLPSLDYGHTVDDARLNFNAYEVSRIVNGTGGQNEGRCQEIELTELVSVAGINQLEQTNVRIHAVNEVRNPGNDGAPPLAGWNGSAFRTAICSDTPTGTFPIDFWALDGVGGKKALGTVYITVSDEAIPADQLTVRYGD